MAQFNLLKTTTPQTPDIDKVGVFINEFGVPQYIDENGIIKDFTGIVANPLLDVDGTTSIDFHNRTLHSTDGTITLVYSDRLLLNSQGFTTINFENLNISDKNGVTILDGESRTLYDGIARASVLLTQRTLISNDNSTSIDWDSRLLKNSRGDNNVDYENKVLNTNWVCSGIFTSQLNDITKEPTGFINNTDIVITYDYSDRTITLNNVAGAYYRGILINEIASSWRSEKHPALINDYFLYYDGSSFVWSTTSWTFDMLQIAYVSKAGFALRECHGLMGWETHQELHQTIGTYRLSGGDFSSYLINSTIATNRRPTISTTTIKDEDLITNLPALTNDLYTIRKLTSTGIATFDLNYTEIIPVSGNQPYYNQFTGGNWIQTLFPNNNYGAIFVLSAPVTSDANSLNYAYQFIQPQLVSGSLTTIQALSFSSINTGGISLSEYTFIEKIIIQYTGANWIIISSEKIQGTNLNAIATQGNYLSSVTTNPNLFSGLGTTSSPLSLIYRDGFIDYNDLITQTTPISFNSLTPIKLTNDGLGVYTLKTYKPVGITELFNTTTNQFNFTELNLGDELLIRIDLTITTLSAGTDIEIAVMFAIGGMAYRLPFGTTTYFKNTGTYQVVVERHIYIGNLDTKNYPAEVQYYSDAPSNIQVNGFYISTKRRY